MSCVTAIPAPRRSELRFSRLGDQQQYVVKNPGNGDYFCLGEQEHFLLTSLDGRQTADAVRAAFENRFQEQLSEEDLGEFLELAESRGLLEQAESIDSAPPACANGADAAATQPHSPAPADGTVSHNRTLKRAAVRRFTAQSLLCWRFKLFDPDTLLNWLTPKLWFFWTRSFLVLSAGCVVMAVMLAWASRDDLANSFVFSLNWKTAALAWLTLLVTTTCHEFAHGLTCKRHGGEVHEIGFLLLFFMPGFYCNVSDAWLIPEKSKRLWVTLAGAYWDLCQWALALFAWRLTFPGSVPNYVSLVAVSIVGGRILFNFNPLLKLDGYYLLGDFLEIPNLRQRAFGRFAEQIRHLLWGAPRPASEPRGNVLFRFGLASWLFSTTFLTLMFLALGRLLLSYWGPAGAVTAAILWLVFTCGLFRGFLGGEFKNMITRRHLRSFSWVLIVAALVAACSFIEIEDRASGSFQLRPTTRVELRAPVAGFLDAIAFDEGDQVSIGSQVARIEVPDLDSRLAQKQAELREVKARLRMLEAGTRPEEIVQQQSRVERAQAWRDQAREDLRLSRQALSEQLLALDHQVAQYQADLEYVLRTLMRAENLHTRKAITDNQYEAAKRDQQVSQAQREQAAARKRALEPIGTREVEAELARREKELAETKATLALLEAGTRPEELDAERAHLDRVREEVRYLEELRTRRLVHSPLRGVITTPRLKEKAGQYLHEGDVICMIEPITSLEAEITLAEQDANRIQRGDRVLLKARALPLETIPARVERIAPVVVADQVQGTMTVVCRLNTVNGELRPGMSGYGRVYSEPRTLRDIAFDRTLRFIRTEFWW